MPRRGRPKLPNYDPLWPDRSTWIVVLGACAVILGLCLVLAVTLPGGKAGDVATLDIPSGSSAKHIAQVLWQAKIIRSPLVFRAVTRLRGAGGKLPAGEYRFSAHDNVLKIVSQLIQGQVLLHAITIPEGLRMEQTFALFENNGIAHGDQLLVLAKDPNLVRSMNVPADSLEGYLRPETYSFPGGYGEINILKKLVRRFFLSLPAKFESRAKVLGLTAHQAVILASLVEKEAYAPEERPRIAAVFLNRLKKDMRLESCASIYFVLGKHNPRLYESDLRKRSPYNTYLNEGLPPGPICSPGLAALEATVDPEGSGYLFFVSRRDGTHIFTPNYAAHLKAKAGVEQKGELLTP